MDYDKLARELFDTLGTPWDDCAREGEGGRDVAKIAQSLERAGMEQAIAVLEDCPDENGRIAERISALRKRLEELGK